MALNIKLSLQQINSIASCISLTDINNYIKLHSKEYEQYLKEKNNSKNIKNFMYYTTDKTRDSTINRKTFKIFPYIIWKNYEK